MGRHKKQLTQEQLDWRNSILRTKVRPVVKAVEVKPIITDDDKIRQKFFYLNNCVYWVNEYIEGRVSRERLRETANALKLLGHELEQLLTLTPKPPTP